MTGRVHAFQPGGPGLIPSGMRDCNLYLNCVLCVLFCVASGGGPDILLTTDSGRSAFVLLSSALVHRFWLSPIDVWSMHIWVVSYWRSKLYIWECKSKRKKKLCLMPTHCTIMCLVFRAMRLDSVSVVYFSIHAPLIQTTLRGGCISVFVYWRKWN